MFIVLCFFLKSKMADRQFDRFVPKRYSRYLAFCVWVPDMVDQLWVTITSIKYLDGIVKVIKRTDPHHRPPVR